MYRHPNSTLNAVYYDGHAASARYDQIAYKSAYSSTDPANAQAAHAWFLNQP
jgi:prepilin-type processing-associated H-X9-DG protein